MNTVSLDINELLNFMNERGHKGYFVDWINNRITILSTNDIISVPNKYIESFAKALGEVCIDLWGMDFRCCDLKIGVIFGRSKEFDDFIRKNDLQDIVKPLAELMK